MKDETIIQEAIKLVDEGISVTFPVNGRSMLPFIIGGKESIILNKPTTLKVGDIVLAWADNFHYVVHRIIRISGDQVTLMGDGNIVGTEHCTLDDIKAIATHVVDAKGHRHYLYNKWRSKAAKYWYVLRPIRRYILAIYRRI